MDRTLPALALLLPFAGCVSASKLKASEASVADARQLTVSLSNDLNKARAESFSLQGTVKSDKAQLDALARSEADLKTRMAKSEADLKTRIAEVETKLASASDQVTSLQKSNKDLQQSLESNKGELSRKVSELVKEKDAVGQKLASTEAAAAETKGAKERELAEAGRKSAQLDAKVKERETQLKGDADRIKGLEEQLKESSARLEELQKAKAALESAKAGLESAKAVLESEKAALEKQKADEVAAVKKSYEGLAAGLKAEISAGEVTISSLKGKLTVNLVDRILFDSGSAEVKPAGRKVLARVGELLNQVVDKDIRIEGHTDNVPINESLRERYASNWELSTARATAVARYLEDHAKVDPARLVAAGLGQWRPVAPNDKPESRALNRRIEIILVPRD